MYSNNDLRKSHYNPNPTFNKESENREIEQSSKKTRRKDSIEYSYDFDKNPMGSRIRAGGNPGIKEKMESLPENREIEWLRKYALDWRDREIKLFGIHNIDQKSWDDKDVNRIMTDHSESYGKHTKSRLPESHEFLEKIMPGIHFDKQGRPMLYRAQGLEATLVCMRSKENIDNIRCYLPYVSGSTEFSTTPSLSYASEYAPKHAVVTVLHFDSNKFIELFQSAYRSNILSENKKRGDGQPYTPKDWWGEYNAISDTRNEAGPRLKVEGDREGSVEKTVSHYQVTAQFPTDGDKVALKKLMEALQEVSFVERNGGVEPKKDKRKENILKNQRKNAEKAEKPEVEIKSKAKESGTKANEVKSAEKLKQRFEENFSAAGLFSENEEDLS